jgi:DNA-nicking Smr family endonuclease
MIANPPKRRRRSELVDDLALWQRVIRDVSPLPGRARPPERGRPARPRTGQNAAGTAALRKQAPPAPPKSRTEPPLDSLAGIDRANAERLKRGRREIEARLDLHGMTQSEAHQALAGFVISSQQAGRRCVLVITGRGRLGDGILRSAVPRWLAEPGLRGHLLGIAPAQPRDGGAGALYLLLRRLRDGGL